MMEEKLKLFATRTYNKALDQGACQRYVGTTLAVVLGAVVFFFMTTLAAKADKATVTFKSIEAATEQGISAYVGGYHGIALPALKYAADHKSFFGRYYLARLYADNANAYTRHDQAYLLYQEIANDYTDIDPDDALRAPYVADSLVKLARYMRQGIEQIGLRPNPRRAAEYLHHAAVFFASEDAQYELAKMRIIGDGVPSDVRLGKHWLSKLSRLGHPGAQAFLADLYWRGKIVRKDPVQALALISVAVKNASPSDRVWVEDIYQNIYCGAGKGVRASVSGMVAEWDKRYGRKRRGARGPRIADLPTLEVQTVRTCRDGEVIPSRRETLVVEDKEKSSLGAPNVMRGGAGGFSVRGVGAKGN